MSGETQYVVHQGTEVNHKQNVCVGLQIESYRFAEFSSWVRRNYRSSEIDLKLSSLLLCMGEVYSLTL